MGVADRIVYVTRVTRLPLVGADGADVGRVADVVLDLGGRPPRVNGFVVAVGRRRVFVGAGRVGEISNDGVRLRRGSVNLRQFVLRAGEQLSSRLLLGTGGMTSLGALRDALVESGASMATAGQSTQAHRRPSSPTSASTAWRNSDRRSQLRCSTTNSTAACSDQSASLAPASRASANWSSLRRSTPTSSSQAPVMLPRL